MKSAPAIAFDYRPSRWLAAALVGVAVLALVAIASCGLNAGFKLVVAILVIGYAGWALREFLRPPVTHVVWHAAGHWRLTGAANIEHIGELKRAVVLGALIVLTLRVGPRQMFVMLLLPDGCDEETRRQLRVRLSRSDAIGAE